MNYRIYLDTSVFGGVYDEEFKKPSKALFKQIKSGHFTLVTSAVVQQEIIGAPHLVTELFDDMIAFAEL